MNVNVTAVRDIPGRRFGNDNKCRHCEKIETLGHVLGFCRYIIIF